MSTRKQLLSSARIKKIKKTTVPALCGNPQKLALCIKVFTRSPKKPNSAVRKLAKVRLEHLSSESIFIPDADIGLTRKKTIFVDAYIAGEGHSLKAQNSVLIRGGRTQDLPGLKYKIIRGARGCSGVVSRKTSRSSYGAKRLKTKKV